MSRRLQEIAEFAARFNTCSRCLSREDRLTIELKALYDCKVVAMEQVIDLLNETKPYADALAQVNYIDLKLSEVTDEYEANGGAE